MEWQVTIHFYGMDTDRTQKSTCLTRKVKGKHVKMADAIPVTIPSVSPTEVADA
jgi:hypothetical protein